MEAVGITDKGKVRSHNEDSIVLLKKDGVFAVADGVGGNANGEIASKKATEILEKTFKSKVEKNLDEKYFLDLFLNIDKEISKLVKSDKGKNGMATTLVLAYVKNKRFLIGNTGDSRAYIVNKDFMLQITDDHSFVDELVRSGKISEEEAINHPNKNIITKALGFSDDPKPDFFVGDIKDEDIILLCSDGLTNELSDKEIEDVIRKNKKIKSACDELVEKAKEKGGKDNISIILIKEN